MNTIHEKDGNLKKALRLGGFRFADQEDLKGFMNAKGRYKYAKCINMIAACQGIRTHTLINTVYSNNIPDRILNAQKYLDSHGLKVVKAVPPKGESQTAASWRWYLITKL